MVLCSSCFETMFCADVNNAPPSSLPNESLHSEQFEIGESTLEDELPEGPPVVLYLHGKSRH